jgi:RNA-directed DNA polymerase
MTTAQPMDGWNTLPWTQFERHVFKLQKRIYQASQRGDVRTAHRLEKLLMTSRAAKYLAVRRVTQDNQGKRTAGVDGVRALSQPQRLHLAQDLRLSRRAQPLRRVWIPKPGSQEKRGLGIPTMRDRAVQALVKLAMEPEWEARFEPNSYGFRPGRSCHDAIEAIFGGIRLKAKYVLDADIAKCFDRINHQALLDTLQTFPTLRRTIRAWLRAGVMDGRELFPTTEGTPQGGVISPLLANVALHGLETAIRAAFPGDSHGRHPWKPHVVRYADESATRCTVTTVSVASTSSVSSCASFQWERRIPARSRIEAGSDCSASRPSLLPVTKHSTRICGKSARSYARTRRPLRHS